VNKLFLVPHMLIRACSVNKVLIRCMEAALNPQDFQCRFFLTSERDEIKRAIQTMKSLKEVC